MSTKRLERTVIEGGRGNKWERRNSNRPERAAQRAFLSEVRKDPLNADADSIEERDHVYKDFRDKLSPMKRWLDAQVGRPWADVRSEVFTKFDTRSVAGRHITFDHLLSSVTETLSGRDEHGFIAENQTSWSKRYHSYYVDVNGILCRNPEREPRWWAGSVSEASLKEVATWLQGRMIAEKGGVLHWVSNNEGVWKAEWNKVAEHTKWGPREGPLSLKYLSQENGSYEVKHYMPTFYSSIGHYETIQRTGLHWKYIENPAGFKLRGPLNSEETKQFRNFPDGMQKEILAYGKTRIN